MNIQWLKETPVAIVEENELPAWGKAEELVRAVRAMGADFVRYPAIRWGLHSFGNSSYLPKYPELDNRDLFGEVTEAMHQAGIKVMAYCHYGVIHRVSAEQHPEWIGGGRWSGQPNHFRACMANASYTEAMRGAIGELCGNYRFEALYIDGPTWYGECSCDWCRRIYRERFGEDMPERLSFKDNSQQNYNLIRDDAVEKIIWDLRRLTGKLPLLFNMTLEFLPTHRTGIPENTMRHADGGNTTEVHRPGSFWHTLQTLRMGAALEGVSLAYLPPGPYETMRNFGGAEIEILNAAYLMHGATPMLGTVSTFLRDRTAGKCLSRAVAEHRRYAKVYHRASPLHEIGLIYPRWSFENSLESEHPGIEKKFHGALLALLHEHRHFEVLFDTRITAAQLADYRLIMLPGAGKIAPEHHHLLEEYVRNGGNLIVSNDFNGSPELLGVERLSGRPEAAYHGREYRETAPRYGYSPIPEAYLELDIPGYPGHKLLPVSDAVVGVPELQRYIEYSLVKINPAAKKLADLYLPSGGAFGKAPEFPLGHPPGIVMNKFGCGQVIYLAADLGRHYNLRRLPETRRLLAYLCDQLIGEHWTVRLEAPAGVVMNLTQGNGCIYVHLLNYCGGMHEYGCAVEWLAPLDGLRMKLNPALDVGKIYRLRDKKVLQIRDCKVKLPRIRTFETFVMEVKK